MVRPRDLSPRSSRAARRGRAVALLAGVALVMAACGSSSPSSSASPTAASTVTAPSTVNLAFTADMGVPDPDIFYSLEGNSVITSVYEGLVQYGDNTTQIMPDLATSWTVSPNGLTYTFQLRSNVMFHDGSGPMTSADVQASFQRRAALGATSPPGYMIANVASYATPSPLTFVVTLKSPVASFLDEMASPYGPKVMDASGLKAHAGTDMDQTYLSTHDLGTGPYTISQFVPGDHYTLTSFPQWWGGATQVSTIHISIIPDISTQMLELESGQLQMIMHGLSVQDEATFESNPKYRILRFPAEFELLMELNQGSGIFTNQALRLAVDQAVSRSQIVSEIYGEDATVATQILPTGELPASLGKDNPTYDPSVLANLVKTLTNKKVDIAYTTDDARNQRVAEIIQTELASAGLNATVRGIPLSLAYSLSGEPSQRPDMLITATNPDDAAPDGWLRIYLHSVNATDGSLNYLDCSSPAADTAMDTGLAQVTQTAVQTYDGQASSDITAQGCYLAIADVQEVVVADAGYANVVHQPPTLFTVKFGVLKTSGGS